MQLTRIFEPRLEMKTEPTGRVRVVNTTGDRIEAAMSLVIPKDQAVFGPEGEIAVANGERTALIPKEVFTETAGPDGVYYLPTYSDSPAGAALSGGVRGLIALGPLGLVAGGAAGYLGTRVSDNRPLQFGVASLTGAACLAAGQALMFGPEGLGVAALAGAMTGLGAAGAGAGEARTRDTIYGGTVVGLAAGLVTGMPLTMISGAAAATLAGQANSKPVQVATGALTGAAMSAAQAALTGGPVGLAAGIGGAVGALAPLVGPPLMQASRNLTQEGAEVVHKAIGGWVQKQNETTLKVLWAVPFAAGMGLMGSVASALHPALGVPGAVFGTAAGAALGYYQGHTMIERMKQAGQEAASRASGEP